MDLGLAAPLRARRGPAVRAGGERQWHPERDRAGGAVCVVRRPRRVGALDAVGRPERVVAASTAGGAAPRGVGRREILRDAGSHLRRSRPSPRFAGAAIPDTRARLHRQVSDARPRPREAGGSAGEGLSHHPRAARWSDNRPVAAMARPRGSAQSADSVRAVVGGRLGRAGRRRDDVCRLLLVARDTGGSPARQAGTDRDRRLCGSSGTDTGTGEGSDAQTVAQARGSGRPPDGDRRRRAIDRDDSRVRSLPLREHRDQPVHCRERSIGLRRRSTRSLAVSWSSAIPTTSRFDRSPIETTTSSRASAPSALPTYCSGRFAYLRGSRGGESARHSPSHPGPIRRVGRAIAGSKSFTSAKANRRRRG